MTSKNPLVSICIPVHNAERWINNTILSALAQTWDNKEIIIVDDGSTDETLKIAKNFESKNLKVISQSNKGACAARNLSLSFAQGDYIQWLDADDILHPQKIESQLLKSELSYNSLILHSGRWGSFYSRLKKARFDRTPLWKDLAPRDWIILHFSKGYFMTPSAWLVSRKLTKLGRTLE